MNIASHELAAAQGFPVSYQLIGTKAQRTARIGNSVCNQVAEALVRAQFAPEIAAGRRRKAGAA
jgi:site-specific DNA-cytosine methylase